jgi:hypothetical protein
MKFKFHNMARHPEQADDEIYLGNDTEAGVSKSRWLTSRLGEVALRADGTPLNESKLRPCFIKRSEVEQAIRTQELLNNSCSAHMIRIYREMLAE